MEQFNVTGMSCAACSARVEKAVKKVPGVTSCSVSLLTSSSRSVIALGGSKSGKPCARLIAPQSMLMRVIRRMTESVKCSFLLLSSCMVSLLPFSFVRVGRACVLPARALFIIAKL